MKLLELDFTIFAGIYGVKESLDLNILKARISSKKELACLIEIQHAIVILVQLAKLPSFFDCSSGFVAFTVSVS